MSNKATSIYFAIFAVLYLGYTALVAGHGIHFTNSIITFFLGVLAIYYYMKYRKEGTTKNKVIKNK